MAKKAIVRLAQLIGEENCNDVALRTVDNVLFIRADKICKPLYCDLFELIFENWRLYPGARFGNFRVLVITGKSVKQFAGDPKTSLSAVVKSGVSANRIYVPVSWAVRVYNVKNGSLYRAILSALTSGEKTIPLGGIAANIWYQTIEVFKKHREVDVFIRPIFDLQFRTITLEQYQY